MAIQTIFRIQVNIIFGIKYIFVHAVEKQQLCQELMFYIQKKLLIITAASQVYKMLCIRFNVHLHPTVAIQPLFNFIQFTIHILYEIIILSYKKVYYERV